MEKLSTLPYSFIQAYDSEENIKNKINRSVILIRLNQKSHCKDFRIIVPEESSCLVPRVQLSGTKSPAIWYQESSIGVPTVYHSYTDVIGKLPINRSF